MGHRFGPDLACGNRNEGGTEGCTTTWDEHQEALEPCLYPDVYNSALRFTPNQSAAGAYAQLGGEPFIGSTPRSKRIRRNGVRTVGSHLVKGEGAASIAFCGMTLGRSGAGEGEDWIRQPTDTQITCIRCAKAHRAALKLAAVEVPFISPLDDEAEPGEEDLEAASG